MSLRLAWLCGTLLIAGCRATYNIPPKPEPIYTLPLQHPSPSPSTTVVQDLDLADLGAIVGDAVCATGPHHYFFSGFDGHSHVSFWVQGAVASFAPVVPGGGRVPLSVLFGEGDVHDGTVVVDRPTGGLGPTEDGGQMPLEPGKQYGWTVIADGTFKTYQTFVLPTRPCIFPLPAPTVAVNPSQPCDDAVLVITGDGFSPGPVYLQARLPHLPQPGELITGKEPPEIRDLGTIRADAGGHLAFETKPDFLAHRAWTLQVYDAGRTRLTTLEVPACP